MSKLKLNSKNIEFSTTQAGNILMTFDSHINIDNGITNSPQGVMKSSMELFKDEDGLPCMIEWDVPKLEMTEHIGLEMTGNTLTGYDGVFEIPREALHLIDKAGYKYDEDFID